MRDNDSVLHRSKYKKAGGVGRDLSLPSFYTVGDRRARGLALELVCPADG